MRMGSAAVVGLAEPHCPHPMSTRVRRAYTCQGMCLYTCVCTIPASRQLP